MIPWLWRWIPHGLSKCQSKTTVQFSGLQSPRWSFSSKVSFSLVTTHKDLKACFLFFFRSESPTPYGNIMYDRRIVRGNTYAQRTLPAVSLLVYHIALALVFLGYWCKTDWVFLVLVPVLWVVFKWLSKNYYTEVITVTNHNRNIHIHTYRQTDRQTKIWFYQTSW